MKKTILGLFLGMSVMGMASDGVSVGEDVNGTLNINANVIAPLSIKEITEMDFGDIVLGEPADSKTAGTMLVTGASGNYVIVSLPETTTISRVGEEDNVTVTLSSANSGTAQLLDDAGNLTQTISGKIAAGQTTHAGQHTGTVTVSVKYN